MAAYRCSVCSLNWWVNNPNHRTCFKCGEKTSYLKNANPMPLEEQVAIKGTIKFERFYDLWNSHRGGSFPWQGKVITVPKLEGDVPPPPVPPELQELDDALADPA